MATDIALKIENNQADVTIDKNGKLELTEGTPLNKQRLFLLLKTQEGDFFYNREAGIPYFDFIRGNIDLATFYIMLFDKIRNQRGVKTINSLSVDERANRETTIHATIVDDNDNMIELT